MLSFVTFGLSPNVGGVLRDGRRLASLGDDAAGAARRLADDGVEAAGRLGDDAVDLAADACPAGHCSCFVAGTLVATAILAGSVPAYAQAPPHDTLSYDSASAETELVLDHRAIEELQVGDRVISMPGLRGQSDSRTAVTDEWQVIDLEVIARSTDVSSPSEVDAEHVVVLTVLRPPGWLASMDTDGDRTFDLELPELRLRGLAHVVNVRGPPQVDEGEGRVVLSTIEHRVDRVLALSFDDASEVVTTPNHPFYSVSRGWTSAGELQLGEAVETPDGERSLVLAEYQDAAQSVFNLEVEGDHEYLVGDSGLRVHNTYGLDDLATFRSELGLPPGDGTLARLEISGEQFYGINAHGQPVSLTVNPISRTHAETDVFQQARNAGVSGRRGQLVVDRELCGACGRSGAVRSMARQVGLDVLEVITPSGTSTIIP